MCVGQARAKIKLQRGFFFKLNKKSNLSKWTIKTENSFV